MNNDLREQAEVLAARRYSLLVFRDTTTEDEPIYVALNPELEGCFAQGETSQEAQHNLDAFRVDYIHHLLVHGLPVPEPAWERAKAEKRELLGHPLTILLERSLGQQPEEENLGTSGRIAQVAGG